MRAIATSVLLLIAVSGPAGAQQSLPQSQEAQVPTVAARPNFGESVGNGRPGVFMHTTGSQKAAGHHHVECDGHWD